MKPLRKFWSRGFNAFVAMDIKSAFRDGFGKIFQFHLESPLRCRAIFEITVAPSGWIGPPWFRAATWMVPIRETGFADVSGFSVRLYRFKAVLSMQRNCVLGRWRA